VDDSQQKRRPMVDRLGSDHWPRLEPEAEEVRESFQEARARSRESLMLDVRLANGTVESFPYAYLTRVKYLPGDTLILRFGRDEVTAEGRNLSRLREAISEHRARFIQEGTDGEEGLKPEEAPHITQINIVEGEES
jgi:hypothetical protein